MISPTSSEGGRTHPIAGMKRPNRHPNPEDAWQPAGTAAGAERALAKSMALAKAPPRPCFFRRRELRAGRAVLAAADRGHCASSWSGCWDFLMEGDIL